MNKQPIITLLLAFVAMEGQKNHRDRFIGSKG